MSPAVWAVVCAAMAGFLVPSDTPRLARVRLAGLLADRRPRPRQAARDRSVVVRRATAALAGVSCAALLGGLLGLVAGAAVAIGCARVLSRLEPRDKRARRTRLVADLPVAVDLLAACLRGGASWGESVDAVAVALGGPLGDELRGVAAQVRLGADPAQAWLTLAREPALTTLARAVARAAASGAPLAPTLTRLAADQRRTARAAASARARAAGVRAVAPLGLCFLPAFVLVGIVPAIVGIAATVVLP